MLSKLTRTKPQDVSIPPSPASCTLRCAVVVGENLASARALCCETTIEGMLGLPLDGPRPA